MQANEELVEVNEPADTGRMSLTGHLEELRRRLIRIIIAVALASLAAYCYIDQILALIMPAVGKLFYLSPAEAFFTYCKVAIFAGFLLALPFVVYEIWAFIIPALMENEKFMAYLLIPGSLLLFYLGIAFAYFLVLPLAVKFFLGFASDFLQPMFSVGQYVSFLVALVFPFGVVFQLPLAIIVFARFGIIASKALIHYRKYVIVAAFIIGGVVSPTPDIFGQILLALPILLLYEISIILVKHVLKK